MQRFKETLWSRETGEMTSFEETEERIKTLFPSWLDDPPDGNRCPVGLVEIVKVLTHEVYRLENKIAELESDISLRRRF